MAARPTSAPALADSRFIDSHCHLDRYPRPMEVLRDASKSGVVVVAETDGPYGGTRAASVPRR
jgi:hypothetical protein